MDGNVVARRYTVENLVIASITAAETLVISVAVSSGGLVAGDSVLVTPRAAAGLTNAIAIYGCIIDATHIGLAFVNASAGAVNPADTFDFDIMVFPQTGMKQQAV